MTNITRLKCYIYAMLSFFILSVAIKYSFADDIQSVKFHLRCAHEFILKENYEDAGKEYREALRLDPNCLDAARGLNALGVHFIQLGSYEKAINNLQEALEVFTLEKTPNDYGETQKDLSAAYIELSKVKDKESNLKLSLKACDEALKVFTPEKFPQDYWDIKFNQGNAHLELAEIKDKELNLNLSVKAFEEALKITPQKPPRPYALTNYFLSKAYFMSSKVKDKETNLEHAIKYLQEYLNLRAEFPPTAVREAYKIMGYMLSELGQHEEAIKEYREVLKLEPDKPEELHYIIGNSFAYLKQYEDAEKEYRKAIELKPDYVDAHNNLGNVLNNLKRFREAEEEYVKAIELNPSLPEPHYNLGYLFNTLGRYKEAESEYRAFLRLKPDFPMALYSLGILLKKTERFGEAEWTFNEALKLLKRIYVEAFMPNYPNVPIDTNLLVKELVRYDEIENTTRKRLKLDIKVNVWQVLWALSETHVEMASGAGDTDLFQDALDELDGALEISRENPQDYGPENLLKMYLLRGKIHTDLEDYARAKSDYTECKKYEPHNPMIKRNLRKVNKLIDERPPIKRMQITIILVAGVSLIVSFLAYRKKIIKPPQFTIFAPLCLAFVMLGITLPLIKTIKIGHIEMEFQKFEKPVRPEMEWRRSEEPTWRPESRSGSGL